MTEQQMLTTVRAMTGLSVADEADSVLLVYLSLAGQKILRRASPYGDLVGVAVPAKYETLQCEIAAYMLNKRGAEGQTRHSENGIDRTYGNADVPAEMLREVMPCAVPISSEEDSTNESP